MDECGLSISMAGIRYVKEVLTSEALKRQNPVKPSFSDAPY
jgi:hypothetical protein